MGEFNAWVKLLPAPARRRAHDPVGQERRAHERVRPSTGPARDPEALETEMIGERGHVVDLVDYAPTGPARRPAVPGPVVRDE